MVDLLTPFATSWGPQQEFFADPAHGGVAAFRKTYLMIVQQLPVHIGTTVATVVISAIECVGSKEYKHAHTIVSIIATVSTAMALLAALKFLKRWQRTMKGGE